MLFFFFYLSIHKLSTFLFIFFYYIYVTTNEENVVIIEQVNFVFAVAKVLVKLKKKEHPSKFFWGWLVLI